MKVSVNWVKQFTDIELSLDELVEKIGAQLGAVEDVVDIGQRYEGAVVARVVACEKHPGGDKLTVCLIDDGGVVKKVPRNTSGYVQVVCGAPNVEPGMLAVWLPPGVTVPATASSEPLILEARDIRGITSHGMLASPKELDFGDDHSGLLHIDEDVQPGSSFAKAYRLDDHIIDIENKMFTHRPDLFGILGIAREVAGISGRSFKSPDWYKKPAMPALGTEKLVLSVKNEVPKLVPRLCAVAIANVKVGPSPVWLQSYLMRVGIRPINNVVDLTNFVMYETGQPLHAYDFDKLAGGKSEATLSARFARAGETLILLDSKTVNLSKDTLVIASAHMPVGIAGVMGGVETAVNESTRNIVLECANFNMNAIRFSARTYGLFTDAATRFTKNPSPLQNPAVIAKAAADVLRLAGGSVASELKDNHSGIARPASINLNTEFVNSRLGLDLSVYHMAKLLNSVEIESQISGTKLRATPPPWRTDLSLPEDIVEEVGRLYGYDHLPQVLPKRTLLPSPNDKFTTFKEKMRSIMQKAGGSEVLTYSFVHGTLIDKAGQDKSKAFHIRNALSPELQYYRLSLVPSLLEKVHPNIKAGAESLALYELGTAHVKGVSDDEKLPAELPRLAVAIAYRAAPTEHGAPFFAARRYSDNLLKSLGLPEFSYEPVLRSTTLPPEWRPAMTAFEPGRAATLRAGKDLVGVIGEPNRTLAQALKLPTYTAILELDCGTLADLAGTRGKYQPLNRFPSLGYDLCLRSAKDMPYVRLENFLESALHSASERHGYGFSLFPLDIYQPEGGSAHKQTTWRIELWHPARTLTTKEVNELVNGLVKSAETKLKARRV